MKIDKLYFSVACLSLVGVLLATYLLWQQFFRPSFQPCNINSYINCDAVVTGPVAKTAGIPTPLYGLIGYIVMIYAALNHKKKLLLSMATFGFVFCMYIAYIELVQLRVICPVCITCDVLILIVFSLSVILYRRKADTTK